MIEPQRDGGRTGVMSGRLAVGGELVASGGQTEQEVLAVGSRISTSFSCCKWRKDGLENRGWQLQLLVERDEGTDAVEIDPSCGQIHNQRPGDIEGLPIVWRCGIQAGVSRAGRIVGNNLYRPKSILALKNRGFF